MSIESENPQKITVDFLFKRENRSKHFQIIKDNRWIPTGKVFTGRGLYNEINECASLAKHTELEDWRNASIDDTLKLYHKIYDEICQCVRLGKDKNIAIKNSFGEILVTQGWSNQQ